jgi:hypothetical protein
VRLGRPDRPAARHDEHAALGVALGDVAQPLEDALGHRLVTIAVRGRSRAGLPTVGGAGITLVDLGGRQSLPGAEVDLREAWLDPHLET